MHPQTKTKIRKPVEPCSWFFVNPDAVPGTIESIPPELAARNLDLVGNWKKRGVDLSVDVIEKRQGAAMRKLITEPDVAAARLESIAKLVRKQMGLSTCNSVDEIDNVHALRDLRCRQIRRRMHSLDNRLQRSDAIDRELKALSDELARLTFDPASFERNKGNGGRPASNRVLMYRMVDELATMLGTGPLELLRAVYACAFDGRRPKCKLFWKRATREMRKARSRRLLATPLEARKAA